MSKKTEVIIDNYGVSLGKKSERLIIRENKKVTKEIPFYDLSDISIVSKGVSLSTDLIWECTQRGITINFLLHNGEPYANLMGPNLQGTVKTRRAQLLAFEDERGLKLGKAFAIGKLSNQQVLLKYFAKYRNSKNSELYNRVMQIVDVIEDHKTQIQNLKGSKIDDIRDSLMGYEGLSSRQYWSVFGLLLPEEYEFLGRKTQGAKDLINSLLNYGYGILYSKIWASLIKAGLDPFAGFVHVDRPGKPSLVFDFIEEFRQTVVDKTILAALNKGVKMELDSEGLTLETRRELATRIQKRLESKEKYEGRRHRIQTIIQRQARHLAVSVREGKEYRPFVSRW